MGEGGCHTGTCSQLGGGVVTQRHGVTWDTGFIRAAMNEWVHTCVTYNSTTCRQYKDGVLEGTSARDSGDLVTNGKPLFIGRADYREGFHGYIDDVRIYSRGVQPNEVKRIYYDESVSHGHESPCATSAVVATTAMMATVTTTAMMATTVPMPDWEHMEECGATSPDVVFCMCAVTTTTTVSTTTETHTSTTPTATTVTTTAQMECGCSAAITSSQGSAQAMCASYWGDGDVCTCAPSVRVRAADGSWGVPFGSDSALWHGGAARACCVPSSTQPTTTPRGHCPLV